MCVAFFSLLGAQAYDDVYLRGDISGNGWPAVPAYQFSTNDGVTYTLELEKLSGQFKIADASWGSINYGGAGAIKLDTEYTLSYNSGNISIYGGETWNNVTMTFNLTTKKLKVTGTATANDYDTVYVVGDINGSSWNENLTTYPLTLKSGTSNVWEGSLNITNAASYIKMKAGTLVYGTGGNDINVVSGTPYTASLSGNAFVLGKGEYQINFVLDKNAESGTLTITGEGADIPTNYQSWYVNVLGPFNSWGDNGVNPKEDNISTTENLAIGTQGFKIKVWNTVDDIYYVGENATIPTDQWVQLYVDAYDASPIQIEGATESSVYTVQFNVETNEVYVTLTSGGTETPTIPENLYLLANIEGAANWPVPGTMFNNEGDGFFSLEGVAIGTEDGYGYFTLTTSDSDDWDSINANRYGPASDGELLESEEEGEFSQINNTSWKVENGIYTIYVDWESKIVTAEKTGDYEVEKYVGYWFNFICSLNNWAQIPGVEGPGDDYIVTLADALALTTDTEFLVKVYPGSGEDIFYTYNGVVPVGQWVTLSVREGDSGGNMTANVEDGKEYKVRWNFDTNQIFFDVQTGINGIEAVDADAVYYNLQGMKVANPENGLLIKVVDGKATKVMVRK